MENRQKNVPDFYLQFAASFPLEKAPFALLSRIGCWERRSGRLYIGRTEMNAEELKQYLISECGVPGDQFEIIPEKDAVLSERRV